MASAASRRAARSGCTRTSAWRSRPGRRSTPRSRRSSTRSTTPTSCSAPRCVRASRTCDLTMEEFKVLIELHSGPRTHGSLSRDLEVSTGAMTNRLDKLEREGLVSRARDPSDRRGRAAVADRRRQRATRCLHRPWRPSRAQLLEGLTQTDKRRLNDLLGEAAGLAARRAGRLSGDTDAASVPLRSRPSRRRAHVRSRRRSTGSRSARRSPTAHRARAPGSGAGRTRRPTRSATRAPRTPRPA